MLSQPVLSSASRSSSSSSDGGATASCQRNASWWDKQSQRIVWRGELVASLPFSPPVHCTSIRMILCIYWVVISAVQTLGYSPVWQSAALTRTEPKENPEQQECVNPNFKYEPNGLVNHSARFPLIQPLSLFYHIPFTYLCPFGLSFLEASGFLWVDTGQLKRTNSTYRTRNHSMVRPSNGYCRTPLLSCFILRFVFF